MKAASWTRRALHESDSPATEPSRGVLGRVWRGVALAAVLVCVAPATALAGQIGIARYDVEDTPESGSGGWSHAYTGTIAPTGYFFTTFASCTPPAPACRVVDEIGGSGTLNDGTITSSIAATQLLTTRNTDAPSVRPITPRITLHLAEVTRVQRIRIYANSFGVLGRATVDIGGTTAIVNVARSGTLEVLDLTNTPLAAIATDTVVLRDLVGDPYDQVSISELVVDGSNDSRSSPTVIADSLPATVTGNTAQATADPSDPIPVCGTAPLAGTVWYSYTPSASGNLVVDLSAGAGTAPTATFYTADASGNVTVRVCMGSGQVITPVTAGETYVIMVGQQLGCCAGPFTLTLSPPPPPPPPNDDRGSPVAIPNPLPATVTGNTAPATAAPGDPIPSCSIGAVAGTVWYSYTPAATGNVVVSLAAGAGTVPIASFFTADSSGSLTQRACTVGGSATFVLTGGTTYLIMVGQYTGCCTPGPFSLTLSSLVDTTPPSITAQVTGTIGLNGWYRSDVTVSWTVNEPDSPSTLQTSGCGPTTVMSDTTLLGTTFTCQASSAGGAGSASVTIRRDVTPPVITAPFGGVVAEATGPSGAVVAFVVTAVDAVSDTVVSCSPSSGSVFTIGDTTVGCSATDGHGNTADGTFAVHVEGAGEQIADLKALVGSFTSIPKPTRDDLLSTLKTAGDELGKNHLKPSCNLMRDFSQKVKVKTPKQITVEQGAQLLDAATRIRTVLGCS